MSLATKNTPDQCPECGRPIEYLEADRRPPRRRGMKGGGWGVGARYAVCGAGHKTRYEECPE